MLLATAPDPTLARRVFLLARRRTIDQDPAFVLRMLVDIAIRARDRPGTPVGGVHGASGGQAVLAAFPDAEERVILEQEDRLGFGDA